MGSGRCCRAFRHLFGWLAFPRQSPARCGCAPACSARQPQTAPATLRRPAAPLHPQAAYQWLLRKGPLPGRRDSVDPDDDSDVRRLLSMQQHRIDWCCCPLLVAGTAVTDSPPLLPLSPTPRYSMQPSLSLSPPPSPAPPPSGWDAAGPAGDAGAAGTAAGGAAIGGPHDSQVRSSERQRCRRVGGPVHMHSTIWLNGRAVCFWAG